MFLSGVIEGFYGRAWTHGQRLEMIDWIAGAGKNCFISGRKHDIKIRARWRETYDAGEAAGLRQLAAAAAARKVELMVAVAPCLDIVYSDGRKVEILQLMLRRDGNGRYRHGT